MVVVRETRERCAIVTGEGEFAVSAVLFGAAEGVAAMLEVAGSALPVSSGNKLTRSGEMWAKSNDFGTGGGDLGGGDALSSKRFDGLTDLMRLSGEGQSTSRLEGGIGEVNGVDECLPRLCRPAGG